MRPGEEEQGHGASGQLMGKGRDLGQTPAFASQLWHSRVPQPQTSPLTSRCPCPKTEARTDTVRTVSVSRYFSVLVSGCYYTTENTKESTHIFKTTIYRVGGQGNWVTGTKEGM